MNTLKSKIIKLSVFFGLILLFGQTVFTQDGGECFPRSLEVLYQQYISNYQSDDPEKLKIALEAAKEYVKQTENNGVCSDVTSYFKEAIAALEKTIKSKSASLSQENGCLSFDDIFNKLTQRESKTVEQANDELVSEIRKRKVNFSLTKSRENTLKNAGANSSLINAIRENLFEGSKEASDIYRIFKETQEKPGIDELKKLLEVSKEYVRKFEKEKCYGEEVTYFKEAIPTLEKAIEQKIKQVEINERNKYKFGLLEKVTEAYKIKDWNEVFSLGEKVLEVDPEFIDLILLLASVGFEQTRTDAYKDKFNNETIRYAELAIKLLESVKELNTKNFGALDYIYKTYKFPDGRENALGWMNYIIGYIKYYRLKQQSEALSYFYKSIQYNSEARDFADIYRIFGLYYYDKLVELNKEKTTLLEKNADVDTTEIDGKINLVLERMIDVQVRRYEAARKNPKTDKTELKQIYDELKELIKLRDKDKTPFDFEKLISKIIQKPMPALLK